MWTIGQLKERGKTAFKRNYWKSVLVALILSVIATGGSGSAISGASSALSNAADELSSTAKDAFLHVRGDDANGRLRSVSLHDGVYKTYNGSYIPADDFDDYLEWYLNEYDSDDYDDYYWDDDYYYDDDYYWDDDYYYDDDFGWDDDYFFDSPAFWAFFAIFFVIFLVVFLIALAVSIVADVFIFNPLSMGMSRFFFKNLSQAADVKEVAYGFDRSYKNVISTLFFRDLFTALWTMLFIIPGIVKAYEYRMIPYILSEYPNMPREQVFATSKQMMMGEKWRAFVLDLSFIGWRILDVFTAGILGIFYVNPYYQSTVAALYEALKYQKGTESTGYQAPVNGYQPPVNGYPVAQPTEQSPAPTVYTPTADDAYKPPVVPAATYTPAQPADTVDAAPEVNDQDIFEEE